jgi:hypothetical protein
MDKEFSQFILKEDAGDNHYVVGYDAATFAEIRIPVSALKGEPGDSVQLQYSANGTSWHNTYSSADRYMRTRTGSDNWSAAIPIGDNALKIANISEVGSVSSGYLLIVAQDGLRRISLGNLMQELNISIPLPQLTGFVDEQDGNRMKFKTMRKFVPNTTALYLNGQRLYPSYDYEEIEPDGIEFLISPPKPNDRIMLEIMPA